MGFLKRIVGLAARGNKPDSGNPPGDPAAQAPASDMPGASGLPPVPERLGRLKTLTPREWEVYGHLLLGRTMKETAGLIGVSYPTVNFHCRGLYKKLGINTRAQLFVQYAPLDAAAVKRAREEKDDF